MPGSLAVLPGLLEVPPGYLATAAWRSGAAVLAPWPSEAGPHDLWQPAVGLSPPRAVVEPPGVAPEVVEARLHGWKYPVLVEMPAFHPLVQL